MILRITTNNEKLLVPATARSAIMKWLAQRSVIHWFCETVEESDLGPSVAPRNVAIEHAGETDPIASAQPASWSSWFSGLAPEARFGAGKASAGSGVSPRNKTGAKPTI